MTDYQKQPGSGDWHAMRKQHGVESKAWREALITFLNKRGLQDMFSLECDNMRGNGQAPIPKTANINQLNVPTTRALLRLLTEMEK